MKTPIPMITPVVIIIRPSDCFFFFFSLGFLPGFLRPGRIPQIFKFIDRIPQI